MKTQRPDYHENSSNRYKFMNLWIEATDKFKTHIKTFDD
ncbi:hypothetical protein QG37_03194 [Candidozyma auris]|uniref:Uncharacterized protein n=1 Tax=Candidozyma auris TaxID=498019 RepID=A0A0L0P177_CANAR|nr:hypothetical protein QG37_03194 [[Candida] auris]